MNLLRVLAIPIAACASFGQLPATRAFEVATVKPTPPDWRGGRWIRMQSAHQFAARNHTLKTLIAAAFNLNPRAISGGPAWVDADHYDVTATTPGELHPSLEDQMLMLRKLLADRFQLTFHREQKELSIYALTVARGGTKLKASDPAPDAPQGPPPLVFVLSPQLVSLPGRGATIGELASVMQRAALDHPVVDQTGLKGRYDFDLEFAPDEAVFGGALGKGVEDAAKPNLFTAMQQQLGLRMEATRGPVEVLVIDRVERPSEN